MACEEKDFRGVDKYPFEFGHYFEPEERKERRLKLAEKLKDFCEKFAADLDAGSVDCKELATRASDFLEGLNFPISPEELALDNQRLRERGELEIPIEPLQTFYAAKSSSKIKNTIQTLLHTPSIPVARRLLGYFEELQHKWSNPMYDSGARVQEVVRTYAVRDDSNWHAQGFGEAEVGAYADALTELAERFRIGIGDILTYDVGSGPGRSVTQLQGLFEGETPAFPPQYLRRFMANYHAIDIHYGNVDETRKLLQAIIGLEPPSFMRRIFLGERPFDPRKVQLGTFYEPHEAIKPGTIHLAFSMMRTGLHNTTEDRTRRYLANVADSLQPGNKDRPGGMLLMDVVDVPPTLPSEEAQANLDDLSHFYWQLILAYRRRYQKHMPEGIDLAHMPCFPIFDNTTGRGFYWRKNPVETYFRYVAEKYGIDLKVVRTQRILPTFNLPRQILTEWGLTWLEKNELVGHIEASIHSRLEREGGINQELIALADESGLGRPEYLKQLVAYRSVAEFPALYITLERPQK